MSTLKVDTILKRTGTGTITLGQSGDTIALGSGSSQTRFSGAGLSSSSSSTAISIDSSGHVTMPLQPAFLTYVSSTQDVNSTNTTEINFDTEVFDLNSDYNTSTKRFTAPVTGKYMLHAMARVVNADGNTGGHYVQTQIVTSNRTYTVISGVSLTYWNINNSVLADMDANDTAYVQIKSSSDTSWSVGGGENDSRFCGYLVA